MIKLKNIFKDFLKSSIIGLVIGFIILAVVSVISYIFLLDMVEALTMGQRATSIIGATGLLIFSGFILKKGGIEKMENKPAFENYFNEFNYAIILLFISASILMVSMLIDYVILDLI